MSDIPSTSVVRHWVGWDGGEWDVVRAEQFDAWLEGEIRGERERIIALLENLIGDREAAIYVDEFITLIKGDY